jgi:hypothetical protein
MVLTHMDDLDRIPRDLVPNQGARLLVPYADGLEVVPTIWCRHGSYPAPAGTDDFPALVRAFETADPCRVTAIRDVYHPARQIERIVSPAQLGSVAGFLATNPPEECSCDPDLTIDDRYPIASKVLVIRLEHEPWCERAGKPSHGTGGLPTAQV